MEGDEAVISEKEWRGRVLFSGLSHSAVRIGLAFGYHSDYKTGQNIFVSAQSVADLVGMDESNVRKWRSVLIKEGWLAESGSKVGKRGNVPIMHLRLPEDDA